MPAILPAREKPEPVGDAGNEFADGHRLDFHRSASGALAEKSRNSSRDAGFSAGI
jgi:hypothetical protein